MERETELVRVAVAICRSTTVALASNLTRADCATSLQLCSRLSTAARRGRDLCCFPADLKARSHHVAATEPN